MLNIPEGSGVAFGMAAVGTVLLLLLVWAAVRRPNRRYLGLRLVATVLAVGSLLVLGLRPERIAPRPATAEALLVTPGASPSMLRTLADSLGSALPVFTLIDSEPWGHAFAEVEPIPDLGTLRRRRPDVRALYVAGHGLHAFDWADLGPVHLIPLLEPPEPGLRSIHAPPELPVGSDLRVEGRIAGGPERPARVVVQGPGAEADSVDLSEGETAFVLRVRPKGTGRLPYTLRVQGEGGRVMSGDTLGVSVVPPVLPAVLVLEAAPGFETGYLKRWVTDTGGPLAVRTKISRDRYRSEVLNLPALDLNRITPALVERFDLVLIDGPTLAALVPSERQALRAAVTEQGLGILLAPDGMVEEPLPGATDAAFFYEVTLRALGEDPRALIPRWEGQADTASIPVAAHPFVFEVPWEALPLLTDAEGRAIGIARRRGRGWIGYSLVYDTYHWVLEGQPEAHAAYWAHVFSSLARPPETDQWTWTPSQPLVVDQPLALHLATYQAEPRAVVEGPEGVQVRLPMVGDPYEPGRWQGTFWPVRAGWHCVAAGEEGAWFYVHPPGAWRTVQQAAKARATRRWGLRAQGADEQVPSVATSRPMPLWPFFLIFLLSSATLWLEHKFS